MDNESSLYTLTQDVTVDAIMFEIRVFTVFNHTLATLTNFCALTLAEVYLRRKLYGYPPAFERKIDKIKEKKKANRTRPEIGQIKAIVP